MTTYISSETSKLTHAHTAAPHLKYSANQYAETEPLLIRWERGGVFVPDLKLEAAMTLDVNLARICGLTRHRVKPVLKEQDTLLVIWKLFVVFQI